MVFPRILSSALAFVGLLAAVAPAAAQSGYYRHPSDAWDPAESFLGDDYSAGDLYNAPPSPFGSPPNNAFDPTRPYGGQVAITAAPGTAAFDEQYTNRRIMCRDKPERC